MIVIDIIDYVSKEMQIRFSGRDDESALKEFIEKHNLKKHEEFIKITDEMKKRSKDNPSPVKHTWFNFSKKG